MPPTELACIRRAVRQLTPNPYPRYILTLIDERIHNIIVSEAKRRG